MKQRISLAVLIVLVLILISAPLAAQESRGAIDGIVKDTSGALLPGVTLTVKNVETNVTAMSVSDSKGAYHVSHLNPGTYSVEAGLDGFKTEVRKGIAVHVGATVTVDFKMEQGALSEVIQVTASTPLLDTSSPATGQVIDSAQIQRLPLGDGTAYMLSRLAPGLVDNSDLHFDRPMDNAGLAGIVANGSQGGNDFTLDGAPNKVSPNTSSPGNNSGVVGFSPPSDAIAEFKVQTNAFDAESGHSAGATVNLALKSGTNGVKANVSYFNRDSSRTATPLLTERAGAPKPPRQYNRETSTIAGPIVRDRTFFMVSYEHLRDVNAEPATYTVPTVKMRQGDFSEFSGLIYDPLTATGSNLTRKPFSNNQIPIERINAVAKAYAALYPLPNKPGTSGNYFTNQLRPYDYNAILGRVDHNINDSNKLFIDGYYNKRQEDRYNWALGAANANNGTINGFDVTHGFDYRSNTGTTLGYTNVRSSNLVFDVRTAWSQFGEWRQAGDQFDPASMGFSPQAVALMNGYKYLPFITFGGFSTTNSGSTIATLGSMRSDWGTGFNRPFTNISFVPSADWQIYGHSIRTGYELRDQHWKIEVPAYGAGRYNFNGAYTRLNNSAPLNDQAQEWAQFLLGLPTTGTGAVGNSGAVSSQFEIAAKANYSQVSHAFFVQDDWQLNSNLTVNLGVRFELDQAMTEAHNQAISGFDTSISSPIEAAALANYAKNPIAQIAVGDFHVRGGLQFTDGGIYNDLHKVMPRAAFAYQIGDKTVLRAGAGLFSYDYYFDAGNQTGFSQPTAIVTTDNNGATFLANLSNPIPTGGLIQPTGASLGAATGLGLAIGSVTPSQRESPYYRRWQIGGQHDLGAGWKMEVNYLDSRGTHLPVQRELNGIPYQYLSTSNIRDTAQESFLSASVANPFAGMLPGTTLNGATTTRGQLLKPFPEFLSIVTEEYRGSDAYRAASVSLEKRFNQGASLTASYTRSRLTDKLNMLNPSNGILENRVSPNDRPNRATFGGTVDLPFGAGKKWGSNWSGFTQALIGGWSVSATYQYQSGFPLSWGNVYYDPSRNPNDLHSHIGKHVCPGNPNGVAGLDCPAWDTSGFFIAGGTGRTDSRIQLGNNVRTFPSTLSNVRSDPLQLLDVGIYKNFGLPRGMTFQLRIESINALNYTVLFNSNMDPRNAQFGLVNQDRNNPRDIQLGGRLSF